MENGFSSGVGKSYASSFFSSGLERFLAIYDNESGFVELLRRGTADASTMTGDVTVGHMAKARTNR
jgi:hypothetical protein